MALVGPPSDRVFPVEFASGKEGNLPERILADIRRELDLYLVEVGRPDPWAYAHYHCGTFSNAYGDVHWGVGEDYAGVPEVAVVGDPFGEGPLVRLETACIPLIDEAWRIHQHAASMATGRVALPSMPILFFGDLNRYWSSPRRVITVGLNPSNREFPNDNPWTRFPGGATLLDDPLTDEARTTYLELLSRYFETDPYRAWFDRSFEPILAGLEASYYAIAENAALHTDVASPVATDPTWSRLTDSARAIHGGGGELWRRLADLLSPDVIIVSVARRHLSAMSELQLEQWSELARVDRAKPFVVSATEMPVAQGRKRALVVFGRCTNLPFGSVSFVERERIGTKVAARLDDATQDVSA